MAQYRADIDVYVGTISAYCVGPNVATRLNIGPMLAADIGTVNMADIWPAYLISALIIASTAIVALNYKHILVLTMFYFISRGNITR